jgi:hypothetical protein
MSARTTLWAVLLGMAGIATRLFAGEELPVSAPVKTEPMVVATQQNLTTSGPVPAPKEDISGLSHGLQEIVRMVQSGTDTNVVLSFIENSPIAYSPSADDIIRLHNLGVPSPVIIALLRHGGRMRDQQMQSAQFSRVPVISTADWYSNYYSLPGATNEFPFVNPVFPVYTYSYPIWWFAWSPGFWFGYLWPYYNCGFWPRNSWWYVAPNNGYYPRGSWGYYSRTVIEPRSSWMNAPRPDPGYVAHPAPVPGAMPPVNYSAPPSYRGGAVPPAASASRGRGR